MTYKDFFDQLLYARCYEEGDTGRINLLKRIRSHLSETSERE